MNSRMLGALLTGIASAFLWASTANSATVTIGAAPGAGPLPAPITVATSAIGATSFSCLPCAPAVWGVFNANQITATGRPIDPLPNILGSTSFQINAGDGGTLRVFVTSQGNTDVGSLWTSSFTSNSLPTGWSVREQTFIDTANGLFTTTPGGTVTQLANTLFNAAGTSTATSLAASGNNYSVTELYTITATGTGSALSTITLSVAPVPIPAVGAGLPGVIAGVAGLLMWRRRRQKAA